MITLPTTAPGPAGVSLSAFLRSCSDLVDQAGSADHDDDDLVRACQVFLDGGLAALRQDRDCGDWLQYDLAFASSGRGGCYPRLLALVRELLGEQRIDDFFFMHKPPGMRLRFHPAAGPPATVDEAVRVRLHSWREESLVAGWRPAPYEPEVQLFGGPVSMRSVHRLFTADSLVWLAFHAAGGTGSADRAWALSLVLLRTLFDAVQVVGWEDLDVWDRVRWQTGRRLDHRASAEVDLTSFSAALRASWSAPQELFAELPAYLHGPIAEYRDTVGAEGRRWLRDYFRTDAATLGPRAALAYLIIFHWNRAALPITRQSLLTEALAVHPAGGAHR